MRYANNRKVWINLRDSFPHPYTLTDAYAWTARCQAEATLTNFAISTAAWEAIGGIGLVLGTDVSKRSAEIGYWLGEPYWGQGIATLAVKAMVDYAFATFNLTRVHAFVFEWNPASARVLQKAGFTLEGRMRKSVTKDGQTVDSWLYALVRG